MCGATTKGALTPALSHPMGEGGDPPGMGILRILSALSAFIGVHPRFSSIVSVRQRDPYRRALSVCTLNGELAAHSLDSFLDSSSDFIWSGVHKARRSLLAALSSRTIMFCVVALDLGWVDGGHFKTLNRNR